MRHAKEPFIVHVVGDGPDKDQFIRQIERLGVGALFRFHGYVEHEHLPKYYRDADIFVLPSLAEGMPNVVLEAMGSGLPIVATRVPGSEELVHEPNNGFLVELSDARSLCTALLPLINDRSLREKMGVYSRRLAQQYTWEIVMERYITLYHQMVPSPR